jgi:hypothetical protein
MFSLRHSLALRLISPMKSALEEPDMREFWELVTRNVRQC